MSFPYTFSPNLLLLIITNLFVLVLTVYSFHHRDMPGALPFSFACMFGFLWSLGSIFEFAAVDIGLKIFWRKFQVIFQLPSATAVTCFLLEYAWPKRWLTRRNLLLLSVVPLLAILLIITNPLNHLLWEGFTYNGGLVKIDGPLMKYFIAYILLNFIMNMVVFVWLFIHSPQNRWPVAIMVIGQIMMRLFYFIDLADQALINFPVASVGIAFTSLMYAIVFFRFRILGPIPLARQAAIKEMPIGMLVLDDQQRIHSLNPAAEQILQITNRIAKGMKISEVLPVYTHSHLNEEKEESVAFSLDFEGDKKIYLLNIVILKDWREQQIGQLLLITDVTDQQEVQAKLLEQGRVLAALSEREQIARELHDDLAQVFAFIDTQGQTIQRLLNHGDLATADKYLARLIEAAREGEVDIRESIQGMRLSLSEHGLLTTLENYLAQFEDSTSIHTDLIKSDDFNINLVNPMVEVQLLRILQEALTNIRKHANASQVWIKFDTVDSSICITVQDDGRGFGFEENDHKGSNHFGLKMMRERAMAVGGTIRTHSQPGQGTEIIVCVPIDITRASG